MVALITIVIASIAVAFVGFVLYNQVFAYEEQEWEWDPAVEAPPELAFNSRDNDSCKEVV